MFPLDRLLKVAGSGHLKIVEKASDENDQLCVGKAAKRVCQHSFLSLEPQEKILLDPNAHSASLGEGMDLLGELFGFGFHPPFGVELSCVRSEDLLAHVHSVGRHGNYCLQRWAGRLDSYLWRQKRIHWKLTPGGMTLPSTISGSPSSGTTRGRRAGCAMAHLTDSLTTAMR